MSSSWNDLFPPAINPDLFEGFSHASQPFSSSSSSSSSGGLGKEKEEDEEEEESWLDQWRQHIEEGFQPNTSKKRRKKSSSSSSSSFNPMEQIQTLLKLFFKGVGKVNQWVMKAAMVLPKWYDRTMRLFVHGMFTVLTVAGDEKYRKHDTETLRYMVGLVISVILTVVFFSKEFFIYVMSMQHDHKKAAMQTVSQVAALFQQEGGGGGGGGGGGPTTASSTSSAAASATDMASAMKDTWSQVTDTNGFLASASQWSTTSKLTVGAALITAQHIESAFSMMSFFLQRISSKNAILFLCMLFTYAVVSNIDLYRELQGLMTGNRTPMQNGLFIYTMTGATLAYIGELLMAVGKIGSFRFQLMSALFIMIVATLFMFLMSNIAVIIASSVFLMIFTMSSIFRNVKDSEFRDFLNMDHHMHEGEGEGILHWTKQPWFATMVFLILCTSQQFYYTFTGLRSETLRYSVFAFACMVPFGVGTLLFLQNKFLQSETMAALTSYWLVLKRWFVFPELHQTHQFSSSSSTTL